MVILGLSSVFFWNAWNELSVHVGFYWFCLLVFLCILVPPSKYICVGLVNGETDILHQRYAWVNRISNGLLCYIV